MTLVHAWTRQCSGMASEPSPSGATHQFWKVARGKLRNASAAATSLGPESQTKPGSLVSFFHPPSPGSPTSENLSPPHGDALTVLTWRTTPCRFLMRS